MDAQQFAYWLQGFAELHSDAPTADQWQSIREHLQTVFVKVTPPVVNPYDKVGIEHHLPNILPGSPRQNTGETPWWLRQAQCTSGNSAAQATC